MLKTALGRLRANQPTVPRPPRAPRQPGSSANNPVTNQPVNTTNPPGPTSVTMDVVQTVDPNAIAETAVAFGSFTAATDRWILPLHPSNPVLFPNLTGVWQHYDRFSIHHVNYRSVPTASMLAGGSVVVATLAPDQLKTLTFSLPSFVDLINFATSFVWPIASEAVSAVAGTILNRARDFLMSN